MFKTIKKNCTTCTNNSNLIQTLYYMQITPLDTKLWCGHPIRSFHLSYRNGNSARLVVYMSGNYGKLFANHMTLEQR